MPRGVRQTPSRQTAVAYATFVAQRRIGFDFIFAPALTRLEREELAEAGRAVINVLLPRTMAIAHDADEALRLMDRHICAAHGLGALSESPTVSAGPKASPISATKRPVRLVPWWRLYACPGEDEL